MEQTVVIIQEIKNFKMEKKNPEISYINGVGGGWKIRSLPPNGAPKIIFRNWLSLSASTLLKENNNFIAIT